MKSSGYIFFFQYKFHQEKSLLKVFVSVIIIIIFKSKIEDSFVFVTIFFYASYIILLKNTRRFSFVH